MLEQFLFVALAILSLGHSNSITLKMNRTYKKNNRAKELLDFKFFYSFTQIALPALAISSLFTETPLLFYRGPLALQVLGLTILIYSNWLYSISIKALGGGYSRCYEIFIPTRLSLHGPYQVIRHPVYTSSILGLFSAGLVIQSHAVLMLTLVLICFCVRSANKEEFQLEINFPEYNLYKKMTGRFIKISI